LLAEVDTGFRRKLAAALNIDRNNLYKQRAQPDKDDELKAKIEAVLKEHKHYGYRRAAIELGISKNRAQRVMHKYGLHPVSSPHQRNYKKQTSKRAAPPNLVRDKAIAATAPNELWACDFTYIRCLGRWYYLATVIDVFSREIVGWSLSTRHNTELITRALYDALSKQQIPRVLHFDQGSEYLSGQHLDLLERLEIRPSASDKGSPWQNGFQERFYGSFKTELGSLKHIDSEGELYEHVAVTLNYYNTKRIHTRLKTNPRQFRQNYNNQNQVQLQTKTGAIDKVLKISGS
jgi:putative transposase